MTSEGGAPGDPQNDPDKEQECMGCKCIAYITPIAVSSYLAWSYKDKEKVKTYKVVKNHQDYSWIGYDGKPTWRFKLHRFNMMFTAPLFICGFAYSKLFNIGLFRPRTAAIKSDVEDCQTDMMAVREGEEREPFTITIDWDWRAEIARMKALFLEDVETNKKDLDIFTKGTLELADWARKSSAADKWADMKRCFQNMSRPPSDDD